MGVYYKKIVGAVLSLTLIVAAFLLGGTAKKALYAGADAHNGRQVIIIDAGHGGFDGGAVAGDGTVEKDINLQIASDLGDLLTFSGFEVVMTRTEDTGIEEDSSADIRQRKVSDMKNRLKLMQEYEDAVFVSIHLNKFTTSSVSGAQVFYSVNNDSSLPLAQSIQSSIISRLQPDNTRVVKQGTKSTYLLHNAQIPAVIVECGFLSNSAELEQLKTQEYQKQMAFAVYSGICEYFIKGS